MQRLYDRLTEYSNSDYYGFHMPGHKRQRNMLGEARPYEIDITEIEGFDDLHHAEGILKEAQERAAKVFQAEETHFLVNGSTVGILSAILGVTEKGDTILVARNCHKSVYHAIYLNELKPVYLMPAFDSEVQLNTEISAGDVRKALEEHPRIRAVVVVSPTYDGVVSDIEAIAEVAHAKHIPLIVDEAHGAHFGFHPYFPENSNTKGADVVIHSLHKTLPSLTQTALLHLNGGVVRREKVRRYLDMLQSSSPSYVLMASIDACVDLLENRREELFGPYVEMLHKLRQRLAGLERLHLVQTGHFDRSKLILSAKDTDMTGLQLYRNLWEQFHLQMEMAAGTYVLAMTSVGDTEEGMRRLAEALEELDRETRERQHMYACGNDPEEIQTVNFLDGRRGIQGIQEESPMGKCLPEPEAVCSSAELEHLIEASAARAGAVRLLPWQECIGYISTEYAYLYPPGYPLIVPGEKVSQEVADVLQWYQEKGFTIEGLQQEGYMKVWLR